MLAVRAGKQLKIVNQLAYQFSEVALAPLYIEGVIGGQHTTRCCLVEPSQPAPESFCVPQRMTAPLAPPGLSRTFYKRELPSPPAVAFSSPEGQQIFQQAMAAGTLQGFFRLIEQFRTQDEPAYCGLASIAMVLNALAIDPRRTWKGPWRFFHEQMLDCCLPLEKVRQQGITLGQAACIARCNGASVNLYRSGSFSLDEFRELIHTAAKSAEFHIIVSYSRKAFLQTGDGHFSPIGGYDPTTDRVLILDTARFKYPPHWLLVQDLFEAMSRIDLTTNRPRGFLVLKTKQYLESVLFTLDVRDSRYVHALQYAQSGMRGAIDDAVRASKLYGIPITAEGLLQSVAAAAPSKSVRKFVAVRMAGTSKEDGVCTQTSAIETFLLELRGLTLFNIIKTGLPTDVLRSADSSKAIDAFEKLDLKSASFKIRHDGFEASLQPEEQRHRQEKGKGKDSSEEHNDDDTWADQDDDDDDDEYNRDVIEQGLSSNAADLSSRKPAVPGALLAERITMLVLLADPSTWRHPDIPEAVSNDIIAMLDVSSSFKVVASELQYLGYQYAQIADGLSTEPKGTNNNNNNEGSNETLHDGEGGSHADDDGSSCGCGPPSRHPHNEF